MTYSACFLRKKKRERERDPYLRSQFKEKTVFLRALSLLQKASCSPTITPDPQAQRRQPPSL